MVENRLLNLTSVFAIHGALLINKSLVNPVGERLRLEELLVLVMFVMLGLQVKSLLSAISETKRKSSKGNVSVEKSVYQMLHIEQKKKRIDINMVMICSILIVTLLDSEKLVLVNEAFISVVATLYFLTYIKDVLNGYRVRKGFYGMRPEEAREMIEFVLASSDDINGGGGGKIFDEAEVIEQGMRTSKGVHSHG